MGHVDTALQWLEGAHMSVWPESKKKRGLERLGVSHTDAILFLSLRLGTYVVLMPIVY